MRRLVLPALAVLLCGCAETAADPRMLSEWMHSLYGAIRVERLSPPVASRLMVYATAALYSGLAAGDGSMRPLSGALNGFPELPPSARDSRPDGHLAAVVAERVVLDSLFAEALPTTRAALARLADSLAAARAGVIGASRRAESEDMGRRIGLAIVAWSRTDGFDGTRGRTYVAPAGPGLWVNDAPATIYASQNMSGASEFVAIDNPANIMQAGKASDRGLVLNRPKAGSRTLPVVNMAGTSEPYWSEIRPFVLGRWDECPIAAPPAFGTDSTAELYAEARAVHAVRRALTDEQRTIAFYWADNAGESGTPVGHWISIASQMVSQRAMPAADAARVLVLTAAAQADAFIASWGYKYSYSLLRPRTYIRAHIDHSWEPLIPSPPFPEYPSGHSTQSAAAAEVLTGLLGDIAFDDSTSVQIGHRVRRFQSFRAAAAEAGESRIYGGIHYPVANSAGRSLGECIGARTLQRYERPGTTAR